MRPQQQRTSRTAAALALAALLAGGCRQPSTAAGAPLPAGVVGAWQGGELTAADLERERARMPPMLRSQFDRPSGRRELALTLIDKRLLVREAARRGFDKDPEVQRQVRDLEERLAVQALLADAEKALPEAGEADVRGYYEAHKAELASPERVRAARVLVAVAAGAPAAAKAKARARAEALRKRLLAGEPVEKVAQGGDGPEKDRGGDLGLVARGELADPPLEAAAFALQKPGEISKAVEGRQGLSVLVLREHRPAQVPSLDDVRAQVKEKLAPVRKRRAFDELRERLRKEAQVHVEDSAPPPKG